MYMKNLRKNIYNSKNLRGNWKLKYVFLKFIICEEGENLRENLNNIKIINTFEI